jgi:hypothetical protein
MYIYRRGLSLQGKLNGNKFMFGVEIPKNTKHALKLDKVNGNNLWKEAIYKELQMINLFQTFCRLKEGE